MSSACFVGELSGQEVPSRQRRRPVRTAQDCGWRGPLGKGLKVCCVPGLQVLCRDLLSEGEQPQTPRPGIPRCFSGRAKGAGDKGFPQAAQPGRVCQPSRVCQPEAEGTESLVGFSRLLHPGPNAPGIPLPCPC